jgi:hypothetical protein
VENKMVVNPLRNWIFPVENAVEIPILKLSFSVIFTTILGKIEENLENPILVKRVLFVPKL